MYKQLMIILVVGAGLLLGPARISYGMVCDMGGDSGRAEHSHGAAEAAEEAAIDVGNKTCPVSGEAIDEATKVTYAYKGKSYNFCCPACVPTFKKDPERYIEKMEKEGKR